MQRNIEQGYLMPTPLGILPCPACGMPLDIIANAPDGRPDGSYSFACTGEPMSTPVESRQYQQFLVDHEQIAYEDVLATSKELTSLLMRWRYEN